MQTFVSQRQDDRARGLLGQQAPCGAAPLPSAASGGPRFPPVRRPSLGLVLQIPEHPGPASRLGDLPARTGASGGSAPLGRCGVGAPLPWSAGGAGALGTPLPWSAGGAGSLAGPLPWSAGGAGFLAGAACPVRAPRGPTLRCSPGDAVGEPLGDWGLAFGALVAAHHCTIPFTISPLETLVSCCPCLGTGSSCLTDERHLP
jgi:hypothetical protein